MIILTPGHKYVATNFENKENGQTIQFIEKKTVTQMRLDKQFMPDGGDYPSNIDELVTVSDGTTNEELIEVLVDRLNFLNDKFPSRENAIAITHLEAALLWLNKRTADRIKRGVEGKPKL